jgi:hypothetical protein
LSGDAQRFLASMSASYVQCHVNFVRMVGSEFVIVVENSTRESLSVKRKFI